MSDANGGFVIHDVLPGPYRWFASVRDLTALGVRIGPAVDMTIAAEDYSARVKLVANRGQAARDFFCGGKQEPGSAAVLGQLLYADHSPGGNLDIRVAWGDDQANHWIDVRTNAVGRFKMCSVPLPGSPRLGGAPAARIQVFKGGNRLLSDIFAFPTKEWIQGVTITLPVATP